MKLWELLKGLEEGTIKDGDIFVCEENEDFQLCIEKSLIFSKNSRGEKIALDITAINLLNKFNFKPFEKKVVKFDLIKFKKTLSKIEDELIIQRDHLISSYGSARGIANSFNLTLGTIKAIQGYMSECVVDKEEA